MIKEIISIYKLFFLALTPIIIGALPVIPYIITNNGAYLLALFLTIPLSAGIAMKLWDFTEIEQPAQQPTEPTTEETISQIKL